MAESIQQTKSNLGNIKSSNNSFKNNPISTQYVVSGFQTSQQIPSETVYFDNHAIPVNAISVNPNVVETDINESQVVQDNGDREGLFSSIGNVIVRSAASNVVNKVKVAAGVLDVVENISDGFLWTGGKVVEGGSYVISQVAGIFDDDVKSSILNWREDAKDWTKETIAYGVVDNAEDTLFNTRLGKTINDASYMKYDSVLANTIENATKIGAELAAATAATVATGGAASPLMVAIVGGVGFAEGAGNKAQKIYQQSLKTTGAKELGIAFSGIANGASWVAKGLFGVATLKQFGTIGNIASSAGSFNNLAQATGETLSTHKLRSVLAYIIRTRNEARSIQNIVDTVGSVFDTLAESIDNGDSAAKTATKVSVGLVTNIALNRLFDIASLRARDIREAASIAEIMGVKDITLKKNIKSAVQLLIEQVDTFLDGGFIETHAENNAIDYIFDRVERSN